MFTSPDRRARLWLLLRIAISVALVAWILARAPFHEVAVAFRSADLRFVLLALALNPLGYLASVSRWRLLIRSQGGDASLSTLVRAFLVGVFFNNFLPSTIGGDAVRVVATARAGVGKATALGIVFLDRFLGLLALVLFAALGISTSGPLLARVPGLRGWLLGGTAFLIVAAALLVLLSRKARVLTLQGKGRALAGAFAWSLGLQSLVVLNVYFLARALHVAIPLSAFFLVVPLALFVMMLPVSINAIGVRENVWAFFLAAFGAPAAVGVALAWLDYGLVLAQALVGGAVYASQRIGEGIGEVIKEGVP